MNQLLGSYFVYYVCHNLYLQGSLASLIVEEEEEDELNTKKLCAVSDDIDAFANQSIETAREKETVVGVYFIFLFIKPLA